MIISDDRNKCAKLPPPTSLKALKPHFVVCRPCEKQCAHNLSNLSFDVDFCFLRHLFIDNLIMGNMTHEAPCLNTRQTRPP